MGRRVLKGGLLVSYNAMQPWDATLHIILGAQCSCACALGVVKRKEREQALLVRPFLHACPCYLSRHVQDLSGTRYGQHG